MSRLLFGSFTLAAMTVGCHTSGPSLSFAVEQRILRETTLDDMPEGHATAEDAVVRVMTTGKKAGVCSGAVIGPRHVLTAQHCVVRGSVRAREVVEYVTAGELHVELGGDYLPWGRVGVREVHRCDGYLEDASNDIAVVVVGKPFPTGIRSFAMTYAVPDSAAVHSLSGFGSWTKPRSLPDTQWMTLSLTRHILRGPVYTMTDGAIAVQIAGAPGDSGGPIVDASTGTIVGVASKARQDAEPDGVDPGGPMVVGARLLPCKKAIETALAR